LILRNIGYPDGLTANIAQFNLHSELFGYQSALRSNHGNRRMASGIARKFPFDRCHERRNEQERGPDGDKRKFGRRTPRLFHHDHRKE
jgi:hypothetical protein